jgi:hypothetical protein
MNEETDKDDGSTTRLKKTTEVLESTLAIAKMLLDAGAKVNVKSVRSKDTALHHAVKHRMDAGNKAPCLNEPAATSCSR